MIFFAVSGLIAVMSFLYFQTSYARPSFRNLSTVQALLNARSGIYKGFDDLTSASPESTTVLPVINTLDSSWKEMTSSIDTTEEKETKLTFDGGSVEYLLYTDDTVNKCEVSVIPEGGSCILRSISTFQNVTSKVEATLGSKIPALPDTVVICYNKYEWENSNGIKGEKASLPGAGDSVSSSLKKLVDKYQDTLSSYSDSVLNPPLTIQANKDLKKIPPVVYGDLLIDGSFNSLVWKDTGTVTVLGRIDISNDVTIEGKKFIATGEITLSGKTKLLKTSVFTQSKLFIGDFAHFQGSAMVLNSVAIYGNAIVDGKSTIVVPGISSSSGSDTTKKSEKEKKIYAIEIGDRAIVDGILVALGSPGDIKTHSDVKITGIMIAQKSAGHLGKMAGLICSGLFVDPESQQEPTLTQGKSPNLQKNILRGEIKPLENIEEYKLPFFLGRLSIVKWQEF